MQTIPVLMLRPADHGIGLRIKRTIRDQWLREGLNVFVDGAAKTLKTRIDELKSALKVKTGKEALQQCIDTKLFGVTFAHGSEAFSWTGPVQFKWGRSLHQAKAELIQGTAAFATRDESEQRSFRNEYIVPFVLLGVYGIANQHASVETGATDADVDKIADGLWTGTVNLITRSDRACAQAAARSYLPGRLRRSSWIFG